MNLKELDELIDSMIKNREDQKYINFYIRKREQLVKQIWKNVSSNFKKDI